KTAFDKSDQLVLEITLPTDQAETQAIVKPLAIDTSTTLTAKIPEKDRPTYAAALTKMGLPPAALDPLQPWFASVTLSQIQLQRAGYSA
ncbi:TraB/GumN family protein, partial [Acinetobacter baumannii]